MAKPLYERYDDAKPVGVYSNGYLGYLFFAPIDDDKFTCDYVVCREYPNSSDPRGYTRANYRRHNVSFGEYGARRAHVWRDHRRVYLDDVLRTDI